jgi:hypothetical protein
MMFSDEEVRTAVVQPDPDDNPQDFQLQFSNLQFSMCQAPNDRPA